MSLMVRTGTGRMSLGVITLMMHTKVLFILLAIISITVFPLVVIKRVKAILGRSG